MWKKFTALSVPAKVGIIVVGLLGLGLITSAASPTVVTKEITQTKVIPFTTQSQDDSALPKGQTATKQEGKNGQEVIVTKVTLANGVETSRQVLSDKTTLPTPKIVTNGTYVAPPVVTAPVAAPAPASATVAPSTTSATTGGRTGATCNDGTHSNATGSGACSHHGGVAQWLY